MPIFLLILMYSFKYPELVDKMLNLAWFIFSGTKLVFKKCLPINNKKMNINITLLG